MITLMLVIGSAIPASAAEGDIVVVSGSIESLGASSITVHGVTLSVGVGTSEPERCHPVALAISVFFGLECVDVTELHESGVGFGVIGRAYLTALASEGQLTPEEAIEMHQSGTGWGQMLKEFGIHPGGKGLGAIMRGTFDSPRPTPGSGSDDDANATGALNDGSGPGNSDNAPGHNKDSQGNRTGHGNGNGRDNKPADKPKKKP